MAQLLYSINAGVVFLEVNDEVKRAILPPVVDTIDSVKALFLRTFPQLTAKYLNLPYVKIYIQEQSKGQLFYELDDLRQVKLYYFCNNGVLLSAASTLDISKIFTLLFK